MIMATKEAQVLEKREAQAPAALERMSERSVYMPRADIIETPSSVVVLVDMPGVDAKSVDITLEKDVLSITGWVEAQPPAGYHLAFAEYEVGDYQRTFTLSDEVDCEGISAVVKNGVLRLTLPKAKVALAKRIAVKAE